MRPLTVAADAVRPLSKVNCEPFASTLVAATLRLKVTVTWVADAAAAAVTVGAGQPLRLRSAAVIAVYCASVRLRPTGVLLTVTWQPATRSIESRSVTGSRSLLSTSAGTPVVTSWTLVNAVPAAVNAPVAVPTTSTSSLS